MCALGQHFVDENMAYSYLDRWNTASDMVGSCKQIISSAGSLVTDVTYNDGLPLPILIEDIDDDIESLAGSMSPQSDVPWLMEYERLVGYYRAYGSEALKRYKTRRLLSSWNDEEVASVYSHILKERADSIGCRDRIDDDGIRQIMHDVIDDLSSSGTVKQADPIHSAHDGGIGHRSGKDKFSDGLCGSNGSTGGMLLPLGISDVRNVVSLLNLENMEDALLMKCRLDDNSKNWNDLVGYEMFYDKTLSVKDVWDWDHHWLLEAYREHDYRNAGFLLDRSGNGDGALKLWTLVGDALIRCDDDIVDIARFVLD